MLIFRRPKIGIEQDEEGGERERGREEGTKLLSISISSEKKSEIDTTKAKMREGHQDGKRRRKIENVKSSPSYSSSDLRQDRLLFSCYNFAKLSWPHGATS